MDHQHALVGAAPTVPCGHLLEVVNIVRASSFQPSLMGSQKMECRFALVVLCIAGLIAPAFAARAQDAAAGQRIFNQCRACHVIAKGARATIGPNLFGVIGRRAGTLEGFRYSADMVEKGAAGLVWTEEALRGYITNPKQVVPKGSMTFPGLRNEQQVSDVIAYLQKASVEP